MKTDGYITDTAGSNGTYWAYSNLRNGAGAGADPAQPAWARVERADGPIPGTKVDSDGLVSAGPTISFTTAAALVDTVGPVGPEEASPDNIWIQWAGVSPQSLREVLMVWSQNIVLMDPKKIKKTGGPGEIEAIRTEGRLMVIAMTAPIAITGSQEFTFTVDAGAVGFYAPAPSTTGEEGEPTEEELEEERCDQEPALTEGSGSLPPLPAPSSCANFKDYTEGGGAGGSGGPSVTDPLLFCNQCNNGASAPVVPPVVPPALPPAYLDPLPAIAFAVCRGYLNVPVRCTHPFILAELRTGGGDCGSQEDCPVWLICYRLTGSSVPLQTFGLDKLVDIDVCNIPTDEIFGTLAEDAACGTQPFVEVAFLAGPQPNPLPQGYWTDGLPGYAGQSIQFFYKLWTACGNDCVSRVVADQSQRWVTEDIIKPRLRTIPVHNFELSGISTVQVPVNFVLTPRAIPNNPALDFFVTNINTNTVEIPVLQGLTTTEMTIVTSCKTSPGIALFKATDLAGMPNLVNSITSGGEFIPSAAYGASVTAMASVGKILLDFSGEFIDVCVGGIITPKFVITAITTATPTPIVFLPPVSVTPVFVLTGVNYFTDPNTAIGFLGPDWPGLTVDIVTGCDGVLKTVPFATGISTVTAAAPLTVSSVFGALYGGSTIVTIAVPGGGIVDVPVFDPLGPLKILVSDPLGTLRLLGRPTDTLEAKFVPTLTPGLCRSIPPITCTNHQITLPYETLSDLVVLSPNMTMRPPSTTAEECPCYQCPPFSGNPADAPFDFPSGTEPGPTDGGTSIQPCTISVKRLQRDWCLKCGTV
jgi:hypothetical protein